MRSFLRSLFVHAITASHFITNISRLVFQYPVVAALFPYVIEHRMLGKPFGLLTLSLRSTEENVAQSPDIRWSLLVVVLDVSCSRFLLLLLLLLFFYCFLGDDLPRGDFTSLSFSFVIGHRFKFVSSCRNAYCIELHCAFLLRIISYVISAHKFKT